MGLAEHQQILARLATDPAFRSNRSADPSALAAELGIDAEHTGRLCAEVHRFASALLHKRRGEVEKLLPHTRRALGERFAVSFLAFARSWVPSGIKKHRDDALAFAETLVRSEPTLSPQIRDLIQLECATLEATDPSRRLIIRGFRHTIADLVRDGAAQEPPSRPTIVIWFRLSPRHRVRTWEASSRAWPRLAGSLHRLPG